MADSIRRLARTKEEAMLEIFVAKFVQENLGVQTTFAVDTTKYPHNAKWIDFIKATENAQALGKIFEATDLEKTQIKEGKQFSRSDLEM